MASKWIAEKLGDMVEDAVKDALGMDDKDKDKDEDGGGFFSKIFDRDGDEEKKKKLREQRRDEDEDKDKDGFFSKIFDRDGDEDKKEKKSGFSGLFSELEGIDPAGGGGHGGGHGGHGGGDGGGHGGDAGGVRGQSVAVNDGDLLDDLMDVANETSGGK